LSPTKTLIRGHAELGRLVGRRKQTFGFTTRAGLVVNKEPGRVRIRGRLEYSDASAVAREPEGKGFFLVTSDSRGRPIVHRLYHASIVWAEAPVFRRGIPLLGFELSYDFASFQEGTPAPVAFQRSM
jgi:hypothetical protein